MKKLVYSFSLAICLLLVFGVFLSSEVQTISFKSQLSQSHIGHADVFFQNVLELSNSNSFEFEGKHFGAGIFAQHSSPFAPVNYLKSALDVYTSKPHFNILITFIYFFYTW
mgnify:CR=1 FL=1